MQSGIPCAMVLTVSFVLSPVIGLFCHRRLTEVPAKLNASIEALRPHDFAVRFTPFVLKRQSVHRIPLPTFVTIAKRPSNRVGTFWLYCCFYRLEKRNIFGKGAGQ